MAMSEHIDALAAKHARIEQSILEEENRPHPDDVVLADFKRQKLRIKDEIARLKAETDPQNG
jgi:hypothetical protein